MCEGLDIHSTHQNVFFSIESKSSFPVSTVARPVHIYLNRRESIDKKIAKLLQFT